MSRYHLELQQLIMRWKSAMGDDSNDSRRGIRFSRRGLALLLALLFVDNNDAHAASFANATFTTLQPFAISATTGEKPQSKLWAHDGYWWSVMPNHSGTWLWRLEDNTWQSKLRLSTDSAYRADVLADGDVTHILLFDGGNSRLASLEYSSESDAYAFWSQRPTLTSVPLADSAETATIALDSTGRLWVASDRKLGTSQASAAIFEIRGSDGVFDSFGPPTQLGWSGKADDLVAITALSDGSILAMWSNQANQRFTFRRHTDGANPEDWSATSTAASQSALAIGNGMADDHLNFAVAADGTLFVAIKTGYDTPGHTKIGLLVRRPSGEWDNLHHIDIEGTRPIVLLDESINRILVAYTANDGGGDIVFREASLDNLEFLPKHTLLAGSYNNVTGAKSSGAGQLVVMASGAGQAHSVLLNYGVPLAGDFNGDGHVDGADFVIWQSNFPLAAGATLGHGDGNGDSSVDGADFVIWQSNFPTPAQPSAAIVAEPGASMVGACGLVTLFLFRKHFAKLTIDLS